MAEDSAIRLCAVGDVALGGTIQFTDGWKIDEFCDPDLLSLLRQSEITIADLDCTFDCTGVPMNPGEYLVYSPPEQLDILAALGVDVVSQANNHSMDYGHASLAVTQDELRRRSIAFLGAGSSADEAGGAVILERAGQKIGFLAYASTHHWVGAHAADDASPGVSILDVELIEKAVKALAPQIDCVVVSLHWGKEYINYPPPSSIEIAHKIVDAGARLVLGHHPHVVQGIENYGDGVICYSLGNFIFPDYPAQELHFESRNRESLLVLFELDRSSVRISKLVPCTFSSVNQLVQLDKSERERFFQELERYSAAVQQADYSSFWNSQLRAHELKRIKRVFRNEIYRAGWRRGARRVLSLGKKNIASIGRSLGEIFFNSKANT